MIIRIAEPPGSGKGFLGIYPEWDDDGSEDARILQSSRADYFSILFTRNYPAQFFERIGPALTGYASHVDIVCGWEVEKIRMNFIPFNPDVEVFPISAMHFNTFDLLDQVRTENGRGLTAKEYDLFFAVSDRPDGLKNVPLLTELLANLQIPVSILGYGRLDKGQRETIAGNHLNHFTWKGKAEVAHQGQRLEFLRNLSRSRALLVTSHAEGYARLIGEALFLGVPVLMNSRILCENWVHLNSRNCLLFNKHTFQACLEYLLEREWDFAPPDYPDGNQLLRRYMEQYLRQRALPLPTKYNPLGYGALNQAVVARNELP